MNEYKKGKLIVEYADEFLAEDNDELRGDLMELWKMIHRLVKGTRNFAEHSCPAVYAEYDALCHKHGEEPRRAKVLADGRPGVVINDLD